MGVVNVTRGYGTKPDQSFLSQMERKLEATQETIIDQQQTIEKFRNLVHNLNADLAEYRNKGEKEGEGTGAQSQAAMMSLNVQLKSAIKTQSRVS